MIARASELFLPTLREPPADAEAASHQLLVRGGFIRQVGAGLWTFVPLGWRVHQKIVQIIREEMDAIGDQEMLCPVLTPAELWELSGRIAIPEVFRLKDRSGRPFVLPLSHEETMTFHAREIQSYKQLPQRWYHFSTKERDEPRPRAGLLRVREFIMKDAYSFDRDTEGLDESFKLHAQAYKKVFARCELEIYEVEAESGIMGRKVSHDYLAPAESGDNELVRCENGDYAADIEAAEGIPRAPEFPQSLAAPEEVETPGVTTIEGLAEFLKIDAAATSKAMPVVVGDRVVLALVRGDDRLSEEKLTTTLESAFRAATEDEIRETFAAGGGSLGPARVGGEVRADQPLIPTGPGEPPPAANVSRISSSVAARKALSRVVVSFSSLSRSSPRTSASTTRSPTTTGIAFEVAAASIFRNSASPSMVVTPGVSTSSGAASDCGNSGARGIPS